MKIAKVETVPLRIPLKPGTASADAAIRAAREEAGPDVEITVDVNCAWTLCTV